MIELSGIVEDFARGLEDADKTCGEERTYGAGIGPFPEKKVVGFVLEAMRHRAPERYEWRREVAYPDNSSDKAMKCDIVLQQGGTEYWAIEFKPWRRMMAIPDKAGKPREDKSPYKKILSPFVEDGSAVTDAARLAASAFECRKAVIIYGYAYENFPVEPMMEAFELQASVRCTLGPAQVATFSGLKHPVQNRGAVYGWEILG
jgi:hypothetical protein